MISTLNGLDTTASADNDRGEDEEPSIVEIELRDLGGKTDETFTQTQLQADKKKATEEGWIDCCECIEETAYAI